MDQAIIGQIGNLIRCGLATIIVLSVIPLIIFPVEGESILERLFSRYIRMVAFIIILGYVLVALKIYEGVVIIFSFILMAVLIRLALKYRSQTLFNVKMAFFTRFYDFIDGVYHPLRLLRQNFKKNTHQIHPKQWVYYLPSLPSALIAILFIGIMAFTAYLRFYDTLRHAAPSMMDAYVVLAWLKYIDGRILFHDGIYPQGYFIYLSVMHKLSATDALYIMKYTGALNGILITLSIYLFVAKTTGRKLAGLMGAFVYGVLGMILPGGWDRQGASLPQEFAMIFLLPAWYYAIAFYQTHKKHYLWTAAAAFSVIGLVHSLIMAFLWLGLACILGAYMFVDFKEMLRSSKTLLKFGVFTVLVAALPAGIGLLLGKGFYGSSLEYLTSTSVAQEGITLPILTTVDKFAVIGFIIFFIISFIKKKSKSDMIAPLAVFLLGVASFIFYLYVGPYSRSEVLLARSGVLWSMVAPLGVGFGLEGLIRIIPRNKGKLVNTISIVLVMVLMTWGISYYKPEPPAPYKKQYDVEINQYLKIANEHTPAQWNIVGDIDNYDLALGRGWHINMGDFVKWYDPQKARLSKMDNGILAYLITKDLFIFEEKTQYYVVGNEKILQEQEIDYEALRVWIGKYKQYHNDLTIYYEDDNIVIYHIENVNTDIK